MSNLDSKKRMVDALFRLLNIKKFEDISVSELCMVAGIHRTTFYLYYENLYELLLESKDEAVDRLVSYTPEGEGGKDRIEAYREFHKDLREGRRKDYLGREYLLPYLRFVKENPNLYRAYITAGEVLGSDDAHASLIDHVIMPLSGREGEEERKKLDYVFSFYTGGITLVVRRWMDAGFLESEDEVVDILLSLIHRDGK